MVIRAHDVIPVQTAMILGTETRDEGGKKFTVFKVELRSDIGPWIVYRCVCM